MKINQMVSFYELQVNEDSLIAVFNCEGTESSKLDTLVKHYINNSDVLDFAPNAETRVIIKNIEGLPFINYNGQVIPSKLKEVDYKILFNQLGITNIHFTTTPTFVWDTENRKIGVFDKHTNKQTTKIITNYMLNGKSLIDFLLEHKDNDIIILLQNGQVVKNNIIRCTII